MTAGLGDMKQLTFMYSKHTIATLLFPSQYSQLPRIEYMSEATVFCLAQYFLTIAKSIEAVHCSNSLTRQEKKRKL